jgi:hypothetical protein
MAQRIIYIRNISRVTMDVPILVVAKSRSALNKFEQRSLQTALNLKDFLEQTGEYEQVSIFHRVGSLGPVGEWIELAAVEP